MIATDLNKRDVERLKEMAEGFREASIALRSDYPTVPEAAGNLQRFGEWLRRGGASPVNFPTGGSMRDTLFDDAGAGI